MNNLTHQRQYKFLAVRRWKELLKDELPDGVDLWHVTKYCSTTRSLYLETADWLDKSVEFYGVNYIKKNIMVRNRHGKYYLPVDKNKNFSRANGSVGNQAGKKPGFTTWAAVRIMQGPNNPRIDITDFTFATSKGT